MRKWIKISIIFIIVLVLALLIFPLVYKNRIAQFLKQKINNQIHGTLTFKDASLSLIRDFPCISLTLDSLSLDGADTFYGVSLLKVNYIRLGFNLKKLVFSNFKELQLTKLVLERPELNLITTASGLFNLTDLMNKTGSNSDTSSGQSINMRLDNVRITDGTLSYIDASDLMYLTLNHLGLQCKGDYIDNKLTLNQTSEFDSLTYSNESIILLKNVRCTWHGPIEYDLDSSNLKLNRNKISLNSLEMDINGNVQQIKDGTTAIMLDFNAPANDLKQLISLIPGAYQAHFSNLTAAGTFKCEGQINGLFDSNTGEQPKISINSSIENGSVKYSHLPYPIQDIQLRLAIQSLDAFGQYYDFEIPGFSFKIDQEPVSGKLSVIQTKDDASIKGDSKGILSLNTLNKTIPWDSLKMSGRIEFNTQFDFKESQINRKEYNKIKFGGYIRADHVKVNSPLFMPFNVAHANAVLDPSRTTITLDSANYGRTDVAGLINITNPLALVTGNYKTAGISIQSNSNLLDINQIMDYNSINSKTNSTPVDFNKESIVTQLNLSFNSSANHIYYKDYQISSAKLNGRYYRDTFRIQPLALILNRSAMVINGTLNHPYSWANQHGALTGNINITSPQFYLDEWMQDSTEGAGKTSIDSIFIKNLPEKTDLNIKAQIGQLAYGSFLFKALTAEARLNNQVLEVYKSNGNLYNGSFSLNGIYQESENQPFYNFKLDLSRLKIEDIFKSSKTFASLVPIAAFIEGSFSSSLITSGKLNAALSPVLNSLDASGIFETFQGVFTKFKPLEEIANKIQIPLLNKINWEKSRNYFEIDKGTVKIKPFAIKSGDINIQASGMHHLNQDMNYNFLLSIPRKLFDKYKIGLAVNTQLEWIRSQASKYGIALTSLDTIFILVNIQGNITKPITKLTWVQSSGGLSLTEQLKEDISKEIKDQIDSAKETITDIINQKKDSLIKILKEDVSLKKEQLDSLTHKVEDSLKILAEKKSKEILDSVIFKQTGKILDSTLQTKLDTLVGGKAKEEIKKINDKLKDWNPFKKKPNSN